jgi:hypothetical protein
MVLNEEGVLRVARTNLDRWLKSPSFAKRGRRALLEWKEILERAEPEQIRRIMTAETDEGQRLRSSSPFAGVLTEVERKNYFKACGKIGSF